MDEPGTTRTRGTTPLVLRLLLGAGFVAAVAATVLAVFVHTAALLRLAVVLAVWAALIAAFAVTWSRRDAKAAAMRANEAELAYHYELAREVSARHEYEAELAAQMATEQSNQIAELREQLDRLTDVLASLADGELLVSSMTLSAQSARFRRGQGVLSDPQTRAIVTGSGAPEVIWEDDEAQAQPVAKPAAGAEPEFAPEPVVEPEPEPVAGSEPTAEPEPEREAPAPEPTPEPVPEPAPAPVSAPEPEPAPPAPSTPSSRHAAPDGPPTSVEDLLAAYGLSSAPRRRRRG